jgi:N-formylglutamate deformylase
MQEPFNVFPATSTHVPILISVPHCGTAFPEEIRGEYRQDLIEEPDDTDWFVDQLYDFVMSMGMTMLTAQYSRWVIDLNRDPQSKPLYSDGRIITGLCPTTNFLGEALYKDCRNEISDAEIERRLLLYYYPYHQKLTELLEQIKSKFGVVLLWDCHSIREYVPTIQKDKFPDLTLGSVDETSASQELIQLALKQLQHEKYSLTHNHPFKGGYITRHFGKPEVFQHALQLEMSKANYMDSAQRKYDKAHAANIREVLKRTLASLAEKLTTLGERNPGL